MGLGGMGLGGTGGAGNHWFPYCGGGGRCFWVFVVVVVVVGFGP